MSRHGRTYNWAGYVLGFSLGGFFDGILLHQILQWHHLLSAVRDSDLRFQVAADGYFHAAMYLVAAVGLWMLWRSFRQVEADGRRLLANLLIGFGAWHGVDAVLAHWVMGIHRVRLEAPSPLFWDLTWLVAFGVIPLALGWLMRRRGALPPRSSFVPAIATLLVVGAGGYALKPSGNPFTTVLFAPGVAPDEAFAAVADLGGRIAWSDAAGRMIVYENSDASSGVALYRRGAILVSGAGLPAGCFNWMRPSTAS